MVHKSTNKKNLALLYLKKDPLSIFASTLKLNLLQKYIFKYYCFPKKPNRLDISIFHVNYLENQALFSTKIMKDITKFVISFSNDWCFQGSKPYLSERAVTVQSEPLLSIMAMSMKYIGKNGMCLFV